MHCRVDSRAYAGVICLSKAWAKVSAHDWQDAMRVCGYTTGAKNSARTAAIGSAFWALHVDHNAYGSVPVHT